MRAYALMRQPGELDAAFRSSPLWARAGEWLERLRSTVSRVTASTYRGIGRYPLSEEPGTDPGWQWGSDPIIDAEPRARQLLSEFLGPEDFETPAPRSFLANRQHAEKVYAALSAPERFEIVELCLPPARPRRLLGFDIGYWGGGNFSILCDSTIWPIWHPPVDEAFAALSLLTSQLNTFSLFPTGRSAERFLSWYRQQPWAETEPSDFHVIAVGAYEPRYFAA